MRVIFPLFQLVGTSPGCHDFSNMIDRGLVISSATSFSTHDLLLDNWSWQKKQERSFKTLSTAIHKYVCVLNLHEVPVSSNFLGRCKFLLCLLKTEWETSKDQQISWHSSFQKLSFSLDLYCVSPLHKSMVMRHFSGGASSVYTSCMCKMLCLSSVFPTLIFFWPAIGYRYEYFPDCSYYNDLSFNNINF